MLRYSRPGKDNECSRGHKLRKSGNGWRKKPCDVWRKCGWWISTFVALPSSCLRLFFVYCRRQQTSPVTQQLTCVAQSAVVAQHTAMNQEGGSQQSNSSLNITPPASFANVLLTPPPTDEKSTGQISSILHEIRSRESGRLLHDEPWLVFDLTSRKYTSLQRKLLGDAFVQDKIRYGKPFAPGSSLAVVNHEHIDTIISNRPVSLWFVCRQRYMRNSLPQ